MEPQGPQDFLLAQQQEFGAPTPAAAFPPLEQQDDEDVARQLAYAEFLQSVFAPPPGTAPTDDDPNDPDFIPPATGAGGDALAPGTAEDDEDAFADEAEDDMLDSSADTPVVLQSAPGSASVPAASRPLRPIPRKEVELLVLNTAEVLNEGQTQVFAPPMGASRGKEATSKRRQQKPRRRPPLPEEERRVAPAGTPRVLFPPELVARLRAQIAQHSQMLIQVLVRVCGMVAPDKEAAASLCGMLREISRCCQVTLAYKSMLATCIALDGQPDMSKVCTVLNFPGVTNLDSVVDAAGQLPGSPELAETLLASCQTFFDPRFRIVSTDIGRSGWANSEDNLLALGVNNYDRNWSLIVQRLLPTKTAAQVEARYRYRIGRRTEDNPIKRIDMEPPLTEYEKQRILWGMEQYGPKWETITRVYLPWRSAKAVQRLYKKAVSSGDIRDGLKDADALAPPEDLRRHLQKQQQQLQQLIQQRQQISEQQRQLVVQSIAHQPLGQDPFADQPPAAAAAAAAAAPGAQEPPAQIAAAAVAPSEGGLLLGDGPAIQFDFEELPSDED
eukprot:m51a1_g5966 putative duo pollen 3 (557) ;mRNA; r:176691-178493